MSRPLKHTSLKKLSAHIKTKGSNERMNESVSRKCISHEKDNSHASGLKSQNDHKSKRPGTKFRIKTDFDEPVTATYLSHRPGADLKSPYYKALAYKKKRPHLNLDTRIMEETNYHLHLEDYESAPKSSKYNNKGVFIPSERMKKLTS